MKKILSIVLLSIVFAFSQKTNLTGVITDKDSRDPLIGANVIINGNGVNTGAATDFNGHYSIQNIPAGSYVIKVTYIGYGDYKSKVNLSSDESINTFDIQLTISAIQLQEYVVTASRGKREKITDAAAAISIISELKIRNASNPNLGDYFKNIKGVDFTASGLDSYRSWV